MLDPLRVTLHAFLKEVREEPRFEAWKAEQDQKVIDLQTGTPREGYLWNDPTVRGPRYGCSCPGYDIALAPTGIGTAIVIKNDITGETLDLSDIHLW